MATRLFTLHDLPGSEPAGRPDDPETTLVHHLVRLFAWADQHDLLVHDCLEQAETIFAELVELNLTKPLINRRMP